MLKGLLFLILCLPMSVFGQTYTYTGSLSLVAVDGNGAFRRPTTMRLNSYATIRKSGSSFRYSDSRIGVSSLLRPWRGRAFQGVTLVARSTYPDGSPCQHYLNVTSGNFGSSRIDMVIAGGGKCTNGAYYINTYRGTLKRVR